MTERPARYRTSLEDSARWDGFAFRTGDMVISAPSKSGTTWVQMICALLIFQTPDLPAPLTTLSPWLDMRVRPVDEVHSRLAAQTHRRFIKTHTPLDGLPADPRVTYLAVGRDPRDVVLSLRHQGMNLRRDHIRRLVAEAEPAGALSDPAAHLTAPHHPRSAHSVPTECADRAGEGVLADPGSAGPDSAAVPDEREYVRRWVHNDDPPGTNLDTLRGVVWQSEQAWSRRGQANVVLVHYGDLARDLATQMRRLADRLAISIPESNWPDLVAAAGFDRMRERAADMVPDERLGIMKDARDFFRSGTSGRWQRVLTGQDRAAYDARVATLAGPELAQWLHHGWGPTPTSNDPQAVR